MRRSNRFFLALGLGLAAASSQGQECPRSLEISETPTTRIDGWNTSSAVSSRVLVGMEIIEGELHADEGSNALLKPQTSSTGDYYWKFRAPIASGVVWMRCLYKGSSITLTQRVEPTATECRVKHLAAPQRGDQLIKSFCGVGDVKNGK